MATALAAGAGQLFDAREVFAQSSANVGSLRGVIRDKASNEVAIGATVVATSPALVGEQVVITDENGAYFINALPPGLYTLTIYYNDKPFSRGNVLIQLGKEAVVNVTVDSAAGGGGKGETIVIQGNAPIIDQGSTKTGVTITDDYTRNIPVGRTFGGMLGAAAGSSGDTYGISISGATSAENTFVIEGINTTDTGFGGLSSNLPNEFVAETEVITGGYNAEFGRATGGIINVITKQGGNQFRGSVWGYFRPGALISDAKVIEREGTSIDLKTDTNYQWDVGAEVGGPIIKDKLWFHVGFNPSVSNVKTTRLVQTLTDKDQDGVPDFNPDTGLAYRETLSESSHDTSASTYYYTAKINGAVNQNNQFQISAFGNPATGEAPLVNLVRNPAYKSLKVTQGAYDVAGKWTSKFNDGKTQLDAVVGFHRQIDDTVPQDGQNTALARYEYTRSLYDFADLEGQANVAGCQDNVAGDMYPLIRNCPVFRYSSQGLGFLEERTNDRTSGVIALTQRVKAAGYHTFKVGADIEFAGYNSHRGNSGGAVMLRSANTAAGAPGRWQVRELIQVKRNLTPDELMDPGSVNLGPGEVLCAGDRAVCAVATNGIDANTSNTNTAAFIQDSWQIRPNFTINAGLRWENQTGNVADALQGELTPDGEVIPETAFKLKNLLSPRLGFIWDPTSEGKSKIFGHWGRFYESVPMDINVRAFGGEITNFTSYNVNRRMPDAEGYDPNCNVDYRGGTMDLAQTLLQCRDTTRITALGEGTEYVSPDLKGQYTQELILGAEYEFAADFTLGLNYIHRSLPVVIEDISTDGGSTYMITNPGFDFSDEADKVRAQAERLMMEGNADLANVYMHRAEQLDAVGRFDKPSRNYDALQIVARQRPTRQSLLVASYTYSTTKGNYPGLFSTETGQLDPNLTSMYDLPDLMANRYGPSGLDRPHNLKVDGYYQFDLKKAGFLTVGASFRAISGIAHNALAGHAVYGAGESYLLPRGAVPRSPVTTNTDVHLSYGYGLSKTTRLEAFVRIFNLFNAQEELNVDEVYTGDNAVPIVGGDLNDLKHIKTLDDFGYEQSSTPTKNLNFGKLNARQLPRNIQLGVRLTF
ncbi:MAG: carboxypeptidase regulatory-like domain-containing protein [Kofleriaceae bacterium]